MLDSALLRPGRFDRQVTVDRPDISGRVQILKVHSRGKQIGKDVDFDKVARRTPGKHASLHLTASDSHWSSQHVAPFLKIALGIHCLLMLHIVCTGRCMCIP